MHRSVPAVALAALAALAVFAGCMAVQTDTGPTTTAPTGTFEVRMTGDSAATFVVSADLVADPGAVAVTYANGTTRNVSIPDRGAASHGPESDATRVEPRGRIVGGVHFEGSPSFSVTARDVPPTGTAVYAVRRTDGDALVAWGVVRCEGRITDLALAANESRIDGVGFGCAS